MLTCSRLDRAGVLSATGGRIAVSGAESEVILAGQELFESRRERIEI